MQLSLLLDTNVIIQFEEVGPDRKLKDKFQQLHALMVEHSIPFNYHPLTENDLDNDKDRDRLGEMLSRLKKYPKLDQPPLADGPDLEKQFGGMKKTNDVVDCQLLFAVRRNCATYLISEDDGLHKRARNAGLEDRVLFVQEAIDLIIRRYKPQTIQLPNVNHEYLYSLDLSNSFFDSLKADYNGFEGWIAKNSKRRCWTIKVNGNLAGLCIYKHDESVEHHGIPMPSMKLCTFKVADEHNGRKFGELLLKMAHQHAVKNKMEGMWVTTHEKQGALIHFLTTFGFRVHSDLKGKDMIFYKIMNPPVDLPSMSPLEFHVLYSPHVFDDPKIKKFVIPIQSQFHDALFPEVTPQPTLAGLPTGDSVPENTIRKVYLSHSRITTLEPGSLIYFYRSSPEQYIHTFAIIERARRLSDMDSLAAAIGKRSVYSTDEVEKMIEKEVLVIDFRLIAHSEKPIELAELTKTAIFNQRPPQSIMELPHERYQKLKRLWLKHNS
ncbi:MAG: GNAT family N-acetyltransferase [Bacteriovoracia bacterium]